MQVLWMLAAAGVWPAVPVTGYLIFNRPQRVVAEAPFPGPSVFALAVVAGLAAWSIPLLASAVAGVYSPAALGIFGWATTAIALVMLRRDHVDAGARRGLRPEGGATESAGGRRRTPEPKGGRRSPARRAREPEQTTVATARSDTLWDGLLIVGLVAVAALYLGFPTESIYGGRDEGVYANQAIYLAEHGTLAIPYPWSDDVAGIFSGAWSGFPGFYNTAGTMTPQFGRLFPAWLAQAFATLGPHGLFRLNALFAVVSLAVFYGLCVRLVPRPYALVATLFLAFNPSQLWVARITLAEILAQLFIWSSLWLLVEALRDDRPSLARWAGVFVASAAFVRFDGLLLLPFLFVSHAAFRIVTAPADRASAPPPTVVWKALYQTALPLSGLAVAHYALFSTPYFGDMVQFHVTKLAVATIAALLLLLASWVPVVRRSRPWLTSKALLTALSVAIFATAAYAYWLRPGTSARPAWKYERAGYYLDVSRAYRQDSLVNLAQYVSLPGLAVGVMGWCLLLWPAARERRQAHLLPLLVLIGGSAGVYLWDPAVYPDHYWAIRRFVPMVIPGVVLCAAVAAHAGGRWFSLPARRVAELVALIFLSLFTLRAGRLIFTFAEDAGFFNQLRALAEKLPSDQLVLTHGYKTWVTPLYVAFGRKVVPIDFNTDAGRAAKEAWVARQLGRSRPAYLLVEVDESRPLRIKIDEATLSRSYTEPTTKPLPRRILTNVRIVELYRITSGWGPSAARPPVQPADSGD